MPAVSDVVEVIDHAAKQPPLWWFLALCGVLLAIVCAVGWYLLKRIAKLEKELASQRKATEQFLKEGHAEMVAALTKSAHSCDRNSEVILQNSHVLSAVLAKWPTMHPLNLPPLSRDDL